MSAERILIDGRSGAGKTELARAIVDGWPDGSTAAADHPKPWAQLVRLDDLYPGWDGLDAGSAAVPVILETWRWRAWDWDADAPGRWHSLDLDRPVVIEGVGALSRASRPFADYAIWVELDAASRKRRALEREGDAFAQHWDRWAAQEDRFIAREGPRELADEILEADASREWTEVLAESPLRRLLGPTTWTWSRTG